MALYDLIEISTGKVINHIEWDGESYIDTGSQYTASLTVDSYLYEGLFPSNQNYINIYGGEFYGTFHGLHDGDSTGTSSFATTASYALTASHIDGGVSVDLDNVDHITFDTTPTTPVGLGTLVWNDGDGTLDLGLKGGNVTLQLGQEQVARVWNAETQSLNDGDIVYIYGSHGNRISVKLADNSSELTSKNTLGMVTETILAGEEGFVTTGGVVHGLSITTGAPPLDFQEGDTLYLGTAGGYTKVKPTAPVHTVIVGFVERIHASQGSIFVKVDNGYELGELHNILTPTPSSGDLLLYDGDNTVWINTKVLSGSYRLSGSLDVTGSITASLTGSLSGSVIGFFSGSGTGSFTGSFYGMFDGIKGGNIIGGPGSQWQDSGGSDGYEYNVTFGTPYTNNNYSISIVGESARVWSVRNKQFTGFILISNSSVLPSGNTFWTTIPFNS